MKNPKFVSSVIKIFSKCRRGLFLLLLFSVFLSGTPAKTITSGKFYGLNSRPAIGPFLNGSMPEVAPAISGNWSAVVAFTNLLFTNSVGLAPGPGTDLLCVWEREGRVWTFRNMPGATEKKLVLDVHNQCQGWDDSGLLGVAFHPGFATNHYMFVYYTWVSPGTVAGDAFTRPNPVLPDTYHDRLERYTLDANGVAIPGSVAIFVDLTNQTVWHHGGGMFFHPKNGFLYWTDGDNSVADNDQVIDKSLYSGVFRVDVDCRGGNISHPPPRQPANGFTAHYFIPNDNPFVGQPGVLEEFFCLGLRSPHRMTYDPPTGRIFIGDVGESSREEIDVIEPGESGLNFQWNSCEGNLGKMPAKYIGISRGPALDYPHTDGRAVIGGYVYRGKEFVRDLGGKYIFGDNVFRTVWAMDETTTPAQKNLLCVMPRGTGPNSGSDYTGLSSFGVDAAGEIYFCQMSSIGGRIYKLQRGGPPPPTHPMPERLSKTGAFAELATLKVADGLLPYAVNSPLWSDGALKQRWMALPTNTTIHFTAKGEWTFPPGTVFVKNFELAVDDAHPKLLRRIETRLLVCDTNGTVYGASYKWRADDSDADMVVAGTNEDIPIKTTTGIRTQRWFYPGRQDCLTCHTPQSGEVLGVKTRQLNGKMKFANGITDNQLRAWNHAGLFDKPFNESDLSRFDRLAGPASSAPLQLRVRSYLDANCSHCHRPGGVGAFFDARFDTPLKLQNLINGPVQNTLGISGAKVIVPNNASRSILFHRVSIVGDGQMPPIAKNVVDANAVRIIGQWINSLRALAPALPKSWSDADIGNVAVSGEASYLNGLFNLVSSGSDIWENADSFNFASRPITGDGQIVAHISALQYTDPWAKAGVMFRENHSPGSKYAMMAVTAHNSSVYQWRAAPDKSTHNTDGASEIMPTWIRLTRQGDAFIGETSVDGQKWQVVDRISVPMKRTVSVGLALCGHNNSELNSSLFDHVTVTP